MRWWQGLPEAYRHVTVLFAAVTAGFMAASAFFSVMDTPTAIRQEVRQVNGRVDSLVIGTHELRARVDAHVGDEHPVLRARMDSAQSERREMIRRMDEAAATRCWLVEKVAPQSIPPPECRNGRRR